MKLEVIRSEPAGTTRPTPILAVHGAWQAAWYWEENFIPYFNRAGFAVCAVSLRGHGGSEGREKLRWTRVADYVEDVASVAADLPTPPIIIGHSMGGLVVQKYLERYPAAASVLLASVPPAGVLATALRIARRHFGTFLKVNLTLSLYPFIETPALAQELLFSATMPQEQVLSYFPRLQDESYGAFLDMMVFNLPKPKRVRVPLLVLGAADDRIFYPYEVQATARAYGTTATIFPDMAHEMMLEAGWEAAAERILAWLEEQGF